MIKKLIVISSVIAIAAASGCAKKSEVSQVKPADKQPQKEVVSVVTQIKITPLSAELVPGESREFTVSAVDSKGKTVTVAANWKVETGKKVIGTLNSNKGDRVVFKAVATGRGTIEAEFNRLKATAVIDIVKKKK